MSEEVVVHAGRVRTRVEPRPGEMWLKDGEDMPVIVTAVTWGRVSFVRPHPEAPGYRESYTGAEFFFAEEWTRLWPR